MIGPVNENDPVEKLWKYSEPVQQKDGFGVQVNSEASPIFFSQGVSFELIRGAVPGKCFALFALNSAPGPI